MLRIFTLFILLGFTGAASAALTIEITQGTEDALPIAIVPFAWQDKGQAPEDIAAIVAADLQRSGRFNPLPREDLIAQPHEGHQVRYQNWRILGMEKLVVGKMDAQKDGSYQIQFQLLDVYDASQLSGYSFLTRKAGLRRVAHQISDIIYEELMGVKGAFDTSIAYVTVTTDRKGNKLHRLAIADADGHNEHIILESKQSIMSPSWSPDGKHIAYVSFGRGRPELYVQNILTRRRQRLASYSGMNNGPVWSPDGQRMAMTLSKDGNPEIYIMDMVSRGLQRVTRHSAIDVEAAWLADGSGLIFSSDRGGKQQLYRIAVDANGPVGRAERLTFEGDSNGRVAISSDGKHIAMVHRSEGRDHIAVLDLESGHFAVITDTFLDESPSFSPNGSMIIYATTQQDRGVLAAVAVDGKAQQILSFQRGNVREPAWSNFKPNN